MKKYISTIFLFLSTQTLFAQDSEQIEMADTMRQDGKIYVVVGVIAIIFLVLAVYLFMIDKKVSELEKKIKK